MKALLTSAALIIYSLIFSAAFAAPSTSAVNFPVTAGKIDFFATGKPSMLKIHGENTGLSGTLSQTGTLFSGTFKVDNKTFTTGMRLRDSHLKEKLLEAEKFPTSELALKDVALKSGESVPFTGILKLHGVEKEVKGDVHSTLADNEVQFQATVHILLTDYGITPPEYMGMKIENPVKIDVSGSAKK